MAEIEFSLLKISIPAFREKYIESKTVTFFHIDITNIISNKQWVLEKRYSEFKTMNDIITHIHPNVPPMPGLTMFKVTSFEELAMRRLELEEYLRECVKRKDILRSKYFQRFLEIETNSPELIGNSITQVGEHTKFSYPVKDFIYRPDDEVLFVSLCNNKVLSKVDSLFSNFTFFWETKTDSFVSLGAICIYSILPNEDKDEGNLNNSLNEYAFKQIWTITFPIQIGVIHYEHKAQVLSIALDDGKISLYKHAFPNRYIDFKEIFNNKIHNGIITGLAFDSEMNCIYSCSMDKTICVTDINTKAFMPVSKSNFGYSNMKFDFKNQRLFISNEYGQVKVFLTTSSPPMEVLLVHTSTYSYSKALTIDVVHNYIFVGSQLGKICILNLGLPGKERLISEMSAFGSETQFKLSAICYNGDKNELICGDEEGRVCVWSLRTGKLVCNIIMI